MSGDLARPSRRARGSQVDTSRLAPNETAINRVCKPRAESVALLYQVMARLHGMDVPVVQFVQASPDPIGAALARSFAEASLVRFGRTLLVNAYGFESEPLGTNSDMSLAPSVTRRRTRKPGNEWPDAVPDSLYAGLYHAQIRHGANDVAYLTDRASGFWLGCAKHDFRFLVVDSGPIEQCSLTLELAASCHGSIISVAAGRTTLPQVQAAIRHIRLAGGTVLGTVLSDIAPTQHLSLSRWPHGNSRQLAEG